MFDRRNGELPALHRSCVLTIAIPVYNESRTLPQVIANIQATGINHELIIVDDGSTDQSRSVLDELGRLPEVQLIRHAQNSGKGAALRSSFAQIRGDVVIVQDADLEYDPADYGALIEPILNGEADVVYGSRFCPGSDNSIPRATYWSNKVITWLFNIVTGHKLTDVETCYKVFRREIIQEISPLLVESRFGIEIELAARVGRIPGVRVLERPIRYRARTYRDGKKIGWTDGLSAIRCIFRYR